MNKNVSIDIDTDTGSGKCILFIAEEASSGCKYEIRNNPHTEEGVTEILECINSYISDMIKYQLLGEE